MTTSHYIVYMSPDKQVALAAMQRGYIDQLMPWINDPVSTQGILLGPPVTYESEVSWYESLGKHSDSQAVFAILARASVEDEFRYVGHTGLHRVTYPDARATSGTFIGDPNARGKGVGKQAKMLLLHHAFQRMQLRKVSSEVKAFNAPSVGHLVACGYSIIGVRKQQIAHEGGFVDEVLLEVFRNEFIPLWDAYQETTTVPSLTVAQKRGIRKYLRR